MPLRTLNIAQNGFAGARRPDPLNVEQKSGMFTRTFTD